MIVPRPSSPGERRAEISVRATKANYRSVAFSFEIRLGDAVSHYRRQEPALDVLTRGVVRRICLN